MIKAILTSLLRWSLGAACWIWGGLLMDLQKLLGCQVDVVSVKGCRVGRAVTHPDPSPEPY